MAGKWDRVALLGIPGTYIPDCCGFTEVSTGVIFEMQGKCLWDSRGMSLRESLIKERIMNVGTLYVSARFVLFGDISREPFFPSYYSVQFQLGTVDLAS
jgi:hypothetical protein